jgi:methyl-accepting chemotaxis protein
MKNKSLRFKLYLLCGFLLMIPVIVGGVSYWAMSNVINDYTRVTEWNLPGTRTIYEVLMQNRQARMNAYQIVMPDITVERRVKVAGEIENIWKEYEKSSQEYLSVPFGPGEKELWEKLKEPIESGRTATLKLVALYKKNPSDDSAERKEMIRVIVEEMNPSSAKSRAAGNALREYHTKKAKENTDLAQMSSAKGTKLTIMAIALASVVGIIFVGIFANSLVKTLTTISSALADASLQVGSGATQIASASQELSQATTEQASALEETAASIEEMLNSLQLFQNRAIVMLKKEKIQ